MEIRGARGVLSWVLCFVYFGASIWLLSTVAISWAKGGELAPWMAVWGFIQMVAAWPLIKLSNWIDPPRRRHSRT